MTPSVHQRTHRGLLRPRRSLSGIARLLAAVIVAVGLAACSGSEPTAGQDRSTVRLSHARGEASYYADKFEGRPTASGEIYDHDKMTAAHRSLPFGTKVRVTRLATGRSVVVRINDRGPFKRGRIIDLSKRAARNLRLLQVGVAAVKIEVVDGTKAQPTPIPDDRTSTSW